MIVNNFEILADLLPATDKGFCYQIEILQRKKDGSPNAKERGCTSARSIKTFYVYNQKDLYEQREFIIYLCKSLGARAYINLNPKDPKEIMMKVIEKTAKGILDGVDMKTYSRAINSAAAQAKSKEVRWVLDIDYKNITDLYCEKVKHHGGKVLAVVPTVNGDHIICTKFNTKNAYERVDGYYIHPEVVKKNSYTLLYYEDSNN